MTATCTSRRLVIQNTALALIVLSVAALWSCDPPDPPELARFVGPSSERSSGAPSVIDSILPNGEALRRFQAVLPRVEELENAARSRDQLVDRFIAAIESGDTTSLKNLVVSKPEYAFLYYPSSIYARQPYELPPDIAWLLSDQGSRKGLTRVTRRLGGKRLGFHAYDCTDARTEGANRFWRSCAVSYIDPSNGRLVTKKLFGPIMSRGGRYKFLSYANDF